MIVYRKMVSVPSFGDSFFIISLQCRNVAMNWKVSVPSFGDSFFIHNPALFNALLLQERFPSPHSGILFLLSEILDAWLNEAGTGFRPLIRGFFFYAQLYCAYCMINQGFRPLIRGFFFYDFTDIHICIIGGFVSVPSFGDSFFIS